LLLFFAFNSVKQGLLIYSAIPLSAIGGIFFLALRGMPFSISAGVGFIALFGVAVLNGIVLIAEFNRLKKDGMSDLAEIVKNGTQLRLRPVLMTAFVASLGFLPMALSNGAGAEVQRPLATVVIGGLMIATLLTLFVLPILYVLFEKGVKTKPASTVILLFGLGLASVSGKAQVYINIQAAIDTALKNNLSIKNEKLKSEFQKKMIKTSAAIPQTGIIGEYGQINSYYNDNRLGIAQSINFPAVYANQKHLFNEEWNTSLLSISLKEAEVKKMARQLFYSFLYLREKEKLLLRNDSMYAQFLEKAEQRFKTGESNILEKTTATTQRGAIAIQLKQVQQDLELLQLQLMLLLNSNTAFIPRENSLKINSADGVDSSQVAQHPQLKIFEQQKKISFLNQKLDRSKLLPDLTLGYYSMTMRGTGADNITYPSSSRFQAFQVGVGIPVFFGSQRAKINASKVSRSIAENSFQQESNLMQNQFKSTVAQYSTNLATVNYYETSALKDAALILEAAQKQFNNGEINYLDWVLLTNQAIGIQSNYLDAVKNLNETIIQINYLIFK
jgi:cobalt-zinc-cadmium resistance protein CzcA